MIEDGLSEDPSPAYRSLSTTAVAGLVLGVVSTVAFVLPTLWPLAVVAAVISWAGAASVARSPETKAGWGIALLGLAIATVTAAATYARGVTASQLHYGVAEPIAEEFLRRVSEEDYAGALELTLPYAERAATPEEAALLYRSDKAAGSKMATFKENPTIVALAGAEPPRLSERGKVRRARFGRLELILLYKTADDGGEVAVVLERSRPVAGAPTAWRVASYRYSR